MKLRDIRTFLFGTLRGRLILGVVAVHAVMMTLFIIDLTMRQRAMLLDRQEDAASALSQSLSTSAAEWLAAEDISGLQELVETQRQYPELVFAILADENGHIFAHTDKSRQGQYLLDLPREARRMIMSKTSDLTDVITPAFLQGKHVGWARVGIGQKAASRKMNRITVSGILYALAAIFIGAIIAWLMGHRFTKRLYAVQDTISSVHNGNRTARSTITGTDEAASIAREFNIMLDALNNHELALITSEKKYRQLLQNIQVAVVVHAPDTRIVMSNPLAQELLGLTEEQLLGKAAMDPAWHFSHEDGAPMPLEHYPVNQVLASRKHLRNFAAGVHRPGRGNDVWVLVNADPVFDKDDKIIQVIITFIDISERKQTQEALKKSEALLNTTQRLTKVGGWEFDVKSGTSVWTEELYRIHEIPKDPGIDHLKISLSCYRPEDRQIIHNAFQRACEQGESYDLEFSFTTCTGKPLWIRTTAQPVFEGGKVVRLVGNLMDITERKQAEEEIRRLNQQLERRVTERTTQLEATNKELEAFAYSVSHDLRAPLRGIDGFSQILIEDYHDKIDTQGKNYLHRVRAAAQRMGQLIDDMLALSRATRHDMEIQSVDLSDLAKSITEELRSQQPQRRVEFIIQPGMTVRGDGHLLRIMLENLFSNAFKFTSRHTAARIEFGPRITLGKQAYFVRDDGAGFDMKYVDKLFNAFQRLHTEKEFPGTGVGLATVQRIIRRHGGKVWAEGEVEHGATFYFSLPQST